MTTETEPTAEPGAELRVTFAGPADLVGRYALRGLGPQQLWVIAGQLDRLANQLLSQLEIAAAAETARGAARARSEQGRILHALGRHGKH